MAEHNDRDSLTIVLKLKEKPEAVFEAVNNVRGWWSEEIDGRTDQLGEFRYRYQEAHNCTIRIVELLPFESVRWLVVENYFDFVEEKSEWTGTEILFEILPKGNETELRFSHIGLTPKYECFEICSVVWREYIEGSPRSLITCGKGQPNTRSAE